jgi:hypothetical protein
MPTRSGTDYHTLNTGWAMCAYCYEASSIHRMYRGMITKRLILRIDDETNDFEALPGCYTRVWTEPHCRQCHIRIQGFDPAKPHTPRFKYQ